MTSSSSPDGARRSGWWWLLLLVALPVLLYLNSLNGSFVQDDVLLIEENTQLRAPASLSRIFSSGYREGTSAAGNDFLYRPLTIASFAANVALDGLEPRGFHLLNVLLHSLTVLAVFGLVRGLFGAFMPALGTALIYAAHPVLSEAVAGCSGRAELLAGLFTVLAWRLLVGSSERAPGVWRVSATAACFALALLSKESAIVLPALVVLGEALVRARRTGASLGASALRVLRGPAWWGLAVLLVVAVAYLFVRGAVLGGWVAPVDQISHLDNPAASAPMFARWLTALSVIGRYLGLFVLPLRLSVDYSLNQVPVLSHPGDPWFLLGLVALILGASLPWLRRRELQAPAFALLLFWVGISVAANLLFPVGTIMAERLLYLPAIGLALLAALLIGRVGDPRWRVTLLAVLVLALGARTVLRNADWSSRETLHLATLAAAPHNAKAHYNVGNLARDAGDHATAVERYLDALSLYPEYREARINLGISLMELGRNVEAAEVFEETAARFPEAVTPRLNLGVLYSREGRYEEAAPHYEAAAELAANDDNAARLFVEAARAWGRAGRLPPATAALERALERNPSAPRAGTQLAQIRVAQGRRDEARVLLERVLDKFPNHPQARRILDELEP